MERSGKRQARGARRQRRGPRGAAQQRPAPIPVTEAGVPAAVPDAPVASPAVFTTEATRALYPWVPARVIAGSVWRGPGHLKVKVDANGEATVWPPPRP
ncbi:MAG: hypothetical protein IPO09_11330 [Anaeromyxobacter sp.]|nr:hypothetical protein [Anaeromyxobacter sp.]MBL0276847.1 hypothetical protein [Anaeromyxobacter sp.]